jgi:hypothetical protein
MSGRGEEAMAQQSPNEIRSWLKRGVLLFALGLLVMLGYLLVVTLVPRWWAQVIGDRVDGRITVGTGYGLVLGLVLTLIALFLVRQAFRGTSWRTRGLLLAAAVLVSLPNLMTLGVATGGGDGAHAGERILDVEGPGFRAATAFGALAAAAVLLGFLTLGMSRGRARGSHEPAPSKAQR